VYAIETPMFEKILKTQKIPEDARRWVYVMFGRMFFPLGMYDNWQMILFVKGIAGSGKSTMAKFLFDIFGEFAGNLSCQMEQQFGLEAIQDCLMWICTEVQESFRLSQPEFNSMVAGTDPITIARKTKIAVIKPSWKAPGMMFGNANAVIWKEASSALRRLMMLEMPFRPHDVDPHLVELIKAEYPALIRKCVSAYLAAAEKYGKTELEKVWAPYFNNTKRNLDIALNPIVAFVKSPMVRLAPGHWMLQQDFKTRFVKYMHEQQQRTFRFDPLMAKSVYMDHAITVIDNVSYPAKPQGDQEIKVVGNYLIGVCAIEDFMWQEEYMERQVSEETMRKRQRED